MLHTITHLDTGSKGPMLELSIIVEHWPSNTLTANYKAWSPDLSDMLFNHGWSFATPDKAIEFVESKLREKYDGRTYTITVRYPITDVESG